MRRATAAPAFSRIQPAGRMVQRRYGSSQPHASPSRGSPRLIFPYADHIYRLAATQNVNAQEGKEILTNQRLRRPVSPHLAIYRPQITWYGSALNRVTAIMLSGGLYVWGMAYLAAPALGWHLETTSMVAAVATWPVAVKIGAKMAIVMPFFYHVLNGFRHLGWDIGVGFANTTVRQTGWAVVGLSVVSTVYYSLFA
jgi:succinate dehydrogenase (ubiquinone) cytochrome b560 subunit